jgi:hypothetical protein
MRETVPLGNFEVSEQSGIMPFPIPCPDAALELKNLPLRPRERKIEERVVEESREKHVNLRQLSTTERIAATLGPACGLPMCNQFFRSRH